MKVTRTLLFLLASFATGESALAQSSFEVQTPSGTGKLTITGHTDSKGSDVYNDQLPEARARTVRDWLGAKGFIPADTSFVGRGERQPVAPDENADGSDNPEGRQQNRRVEVEIDSCG